MAATSCCHVALCAFPFGSHATTLLLLAKRLSASAPDIRFSFLSTAASNATLFKGGNVAFGNIVPRAIPESEPHALLGKGNPMKAIEDFVAAAPVNFRRAMEADEAEVGVAISCVISDAFMWFCQEIAEEKDVPWIAFYAPESASLSAHLYTDVLRNEIPVLQGVNGEDDITVHCVPGFSCVRITDLPSGIVAGNCDSPFSQMLHKMGLTLFKAQAVVVNSFEELSPTISKDLKSKMRLLNVGPLPLTSPPQKEPEDQYGCLEWLDKQQVQSVAYISFGTFAVPPEQELVALAEALEDARVPFIWSISDSVKMKLSSSFVERISSDKSLRMIVPWAPQMDILAHSSVGIFITHCGWNSVLESIVNGVPVICRPILGDQMLNQRFVESEFKFGVGIEGGIFTKSSVQKALHQVLSSEEGKEMRNKVKMLKELARESIKPGASSNENFNALIKLVTNQREA